MITVHLDYGGEQVPVPYQSADELLGDEVLRDILDGGVATATIRLGALRLHARPLATWEELREVIVKSATAILRASSG